MGPLLQAEFRVALGRVGFTTGRAEGGLIADQPRHANVGLISHIGGHKYAGNVIVYIPPSFADGDGSNGKKHGLAGKGIWYGRIEPRHVEGIVKETVLGGRVISDHFRGGIDEGGNILRL
jgi:hypothetical protein